MLERNLISAEELVARLGDPALALLDFRLGDERGTALERYEAGHIPGAAFVDFDRELTPAGGPGRRPLPPAVQLEAVMQRAGVPNDGDVVVYDDDRGTIAARLWWMLRTYGHSSVAVLDGGLEAFPSALATGPPPPGQPSGFLLREPDADAIAWYADVAGRPGTAILLDARAPEYFRGEVAPQDPRPGRIPGARHAHALESLAADGRLLPPAELEARFRSLGVERGEDVIAYCGAGVLACHLLLALEEAGLPGGRLYVGSWSDWSSRRDAKAERG